MGAKLNFKTHLQNTVLDFFEPFRAPLEFFRNFFKFIRNQHKILSFLIPVLSFCKSLFYKRVIDSNFATTTPLLMHN